MSNLNNQEQENLKLAKLVQDLSDHPGWVEVLRPWIQVKLQESFPDPSAFKSVEEFTYAALASSALKKALAEILMFVENQKQTMEYLQKKDRGELENKFKIGG